MAVELGIEINETKEVTHRWEHALADMVSGTVKLAPAIYNSLVKVKEPVFVKTKQSSREGCYISGRTSGILLPLKELH
jgi:hypothetical protein